MANNQVSDKWPMASLFHVMLLSCAFKLPIRSTWCLSTISWWLFESTKAEKDGQKLDANCRWKITDSVRSKSMMGFYGSQLLLTSWSSFMADIHHVGIDMKRFGKRSCCFPPCIIHSVQNLVDLFNQLKVHLTFIRRRRRCRCLKEETQITWWNATIDEMKLLKCCNPLAQQSSCFTFIMNWPTLERFNKSVNQ